MNMIVVFIYVIIIVFINTIMVVSIYKTIVIFTPTIIVVIIIIITGVRCSKHVFIFM